MKAFRQYPSHMHSKLCHVIGEAGPQCKNVSVLFLGFTLALRTKHWNERHRIPLSRGQVRDQLVHGNVSRECVCRPHGTLSSAIRIKTRTLRLTANLTF